MLKYSNVDREAKLHDLVKVDGKSDALYEVIVIIPDKKAITIVNSGNHVHVTTVTIDEVTYCGAKTA